MVRHESVDRLVARAHDDPRTLPALLDLAAHDPAWQVRDEAVWRLQPGDDWDPDDLTRH